MPESRFKPAAQVRQTRSWQREWTANEPGQEDASICADERSQYACRKHQYLNLSETTTKDAK
jgi:hypothetical protein